MNAVVKKKFKDLKSIIGKMKDYVHLEEIGLISVMCFLL